LSENNVLIPSQTAFLQKNLEGFSPDHWHAELAGKAGSDRRFYRVIDPRAGRSSVLVVWDSSDPDWERYLGIQHEVAEHTNLLPRIYAWDDTLGLILEEDLGRWTLRDSCKGLDREEVQRRYRQVIERLVEWHRIPLGDSPHISGRTMDREMFLWESGYFAEHCVREYFGIVGLPGGWEEERVRLAEAASMLSPLCMHRDFQSENIMVQDESIRFIDFQGARRGPAEYDIASLLWDAYSPVGDDPDLVASLLEYYLRLAGVPADYQAFTTASIQRLLQALGAFANLSIHKGKDWYRHYIPIALQRLSRLVPPQSPYPRLHTIVDRCRARLVASE
jgi:hypothetical protein